AIGAKVRMSFNELTALSYELDPTLTEIEKNVAVLIACAELAEIAKWPFPLVIRLTRLVHCLDGLSKGIRDPLLEPKNPMHGRPTQSIERWRMYCVLAVQARRALDGENAKKAQTSFLRDLEHALELERASPMWHVLFNARSDSQAASEEERRCML